MNHKERLIFRNQFLKKVYASPSKSENKSLVGCIHHLTFHLRALSMQIKRNTAQ